MGPDIPGIIVDSRYVKLVAEMVIRQNVKCPCEFSARMSVRERRLFVVKNDEAEATFKQYKRYDNTRILHPLNPKYKDIVWNKDQQYRIVGVVMEKKRYK